MTPADLHSWVCARWQEKLDTARAAGARGMVWTADADGRVDHDGRDVYPIVYDDHGYPFDAEAQHIADFDPSFTIGVCEAALERLDRHQYGGRAALAGFDECRCANTWPCVEFLADASVFRTHPDFPRS